MKINCNRIIYRTEILNIKIFPNLCNLTFYSKHRNLLIELEWSKFVFKIQRVCYITWENSETAFLEKFKDQRGKSDHLTLEHELNIFVPRAKCFIYKFYSFNPNLLNFCDLFISYRNQHFLLNIIGKLN